MTDKALPTAVMDWLTHTPQKHTELHYASLLQTCQCAQLLGEKTTLPPLLKNREKTTLLEDYFTCGIDIAEQLLPLHCDTQTISAALLYPFFTANDFCREQITQQLDLPIYKLLLGLKKMEAIDRVPSQNDKIVFRPNQLDNLRRMLLATVDDIRIILIKLAERLKTMIYLRQADLTLQQETAKQITALYAPLANRLGIGHIKWQLEDWSFRYLDPANYSKISKELNARRQDREIYIKDVQQQLEQVMKNSGIKHYDVAGRAKHIYSIYRKITRKQLPIQQIYDSNAFRILVPSIEDCYAILSHIHEKWPHISHEFDDYIAKPKPNGYKSIHTIVTGPNQRHVEIQIRTFAMHEEAELGIAAHWKYKENHKSMGSYEHKIHLLRDMINWQKELSVDDEERRQLYNKLFEDRVYVFTPNNEVLDLPLGSTPLDVAYHIHTELGHRCRGAKINHKIVPLTQKIKTGDVIEILTSKDHLPSRDWLNPDLGYLHTKAALSKVRHWFTKQFREEKILKGQEIWEKLAKREGLNKNVLNEVLPHYHFKTAEDLFIALEAGNISTQTLLRQLKPTAIAAKPEAWSDKELAIKSSAKPMVVAGTENLLTQLARCCQPIPGDPITGYITQGRGVTIHRQDCYNLLQAQKIRPERILEVHWGESQPNKYPVNIAIEAIDRAGLLRDISAIIANENISVLGITSHVDALKNRAFIQLTIGMSDLAALQKILQHLRHLSDVIKAERN